MPNVEDSMLPAHGIKTTQLSTMTNRLPGDLRHVSNQATLFICNATYEISIS
jgi:hypothetical protein